MNFVARQRWWGGLVLLLFPLFFIGGADYYDPRSVKEIWNLGHFLFFALFTLVLDDWLKAKGRSIFFRVVGTSCIVLGLGLGIELIQLSLANRSCSLSDVVRDLSGCAIVLLWRAGYPPLSFRTLLCTTLLLIVSCINFFPLGAALADEYRGYRDFPMLAGFENDGEFSRWTSGRRGDFQRVSAPRVEGDFAAKITLTTDKYSGVSLDHFPRDWSGKSGLAFHVFNPGEQLILHYRVHDELHTTGEQRYSDRYNGRAVLENGWNEIVIPLADIINGPTARKMDITKISGFVLFVMQQPARRVLYLDNVRLL